MKRNPEDKYSTTTNSMILEDNDTGEQIIFLIDYENRWVLRPMLEEDIKPFIDQYKDITSKEKREKRRTLYENLQKEDSQNYFFCIERIIGEENKDDPTSIYGLPREPIGVGGRSDEVIMLDKRIDSEISAFLYEVNEPIGMCIDAMLPMIAEYLNVKKTQVFFIAKPQKIAQWILGYIYMF